MCNTKSDVAMMNICRETNYFHVLCSIQNKNSSPFLSLRYVLSLFLNFGHFSASRPDKKMVLTKRSEVDFQGYICRTNMIVSKNTYEIIQEEVTHWKTTHFHRPRRARWHVTQEDNNIKKHLILKEKMALNTRLMRCWHNNNNNKNH